MPTDLDAVTKWMTAHLSTASLGRATEAPGSTDDPDSEICLSKITSSASRSSSINVCSTGNPAFLQKQILSYEQLIMQLVVQLDDINDPADGDRPGEPPIAVRSNPKEEVYEAVQLIARKIFALKLQAHSAHVMDREHHTHSPATTATSPHISPTLVQVDPGIVQFQEHAKVQLMRAVTHSRRLHVAEHGETVTLSDAAHQVHYLQTGSTVPRQASPKAQHTPESDLAMRLQTTLTTARAVLGEYPHPPDGDREEVANDRLSDCPSLSTVTSVSPTTGEPSPTAGMGDGMPQPHIIHSPRHTQDDVVLLQHELSNVQEREARSAAVRARWHTKLLELAQSLADIGVADMTQEFAVADTLGEEELQSMVDWLTAHLRASATTTRRIRLDTTGEQVDQSCSALDLDEFPRSPIQPRSDRSSDDEQEEQEDLDPIAGAAEPNHPERVDKSALVTWISQAVDRSVLAVAEPYSGVDRSLLAVPSTRDASTDCHATAVLFADAATDCRDDSQAPPKRDVGCAAGTSTQLMRCIGVDTNDLPLGDYRELMRHKLLHEAALAQLSEMQRELAVHKAQFSETSRRLEQEAQSLQEAENRRQEQERELHQQKKTVDRLRKDRLRIEDLLRNRLPAVLLLLAGASNYSAAPSTGGQPPPGPGASPHRHCHHAHRDSSPTPASAPGCTSSASKRSRSATPTTVTKQGKPPLPTEGTAAGILLLGQTGSATGVTGLDAAEALWTEMEVRVGTLVTEIELARKDRDSERRRRKEVEERERHELQHCLELIKILTEKLESMQRHIDHLAARVGLEPTPEQEGEVIHDFGERTLVAIAHHLNQASPRRAEELCDLERRLGAMTERARELEGEVREKDAHLALLLEGEKHQRTAFQVHKDRCTSSLRELQERLKTETATREELEVAVRALRVENDQLLSSLALTRHQLNEMRQLQARREKEKERRRTEREGKPLHASTNRRMPESDVLAETVRATARSSSHSRDSARQLLHDGD
eukprot:TRINITY_DN25362_c0_g1_i1.p1 TRINITY_DN25362_c0_g1~~TRINITY_DN25362_c0_g1_i1.p1  ORF type:complete len:1007 (+),score=163.83 TRINITY_DN25362_c0_g1_i1:29-3022(+)